MGGSIGDTHFLFENGSGALLSQTPKNTKEGNSIE
jgi:hypothetical protein